MARIARIGVAGFHYVRNEGLSELQVLQEDEDKKSFLNIVCQTSHLYRFKLHAFALGDNQFDMLIQTTDDNLPLVMRQISSQYSKYHNAKTKRSGHIWVDRYASWYVGDTRLLQTLYRFLESQIDADKHKTYTSTYYLLNNVFLSCLKESFLLKNYNMEKLKTLASIAFTPEELEDIETFKKESYFVKADKVLKKREIPLAQYFDDITDKASRNERIRQAFHDGYTQSEIARELGISQPTVSLSIHQKKVTRKKQKPLKKPHVRNLHAPELEEKYKKHFDGLMESLKKYH